MPNSAMRIGSPIASSEPNATSRITMAARMPMSSAGPRPPGSWNMRPPSAIADAAAGGVVRRGADVARWCASGIFDAARSNCTVA